MVRAHERVTQAAELLVAGQGLPAADLLGAGDGPGHDRVGFSNGLAHAGSIAQQRQRVTRGDGVTERPDPTNPQAQRLLRAGGLGRA